MYLVIAREDRRNVTSTGLLFYFSRSQNNQIFSDIIQSTIPKQYRFHAQRFLLKWNK